MRAIIKINNVGNQNKTNKMWNCFNQIHNATKSNTFIIEDISIIIPETFLLNKEIIAPANETTYIPMLMYGSSMIYGFCFMANIKNINNTSKT